jgi:hypothetical protein
MQVAEERRICDTGKVYMLTICPTSACIEIKPSSTAFLSKIDMAIAKHTDANAS